MPSAPEQATKKRVLAQEGLFTEPGAGGEKPRLIGSRCTSCGEVTFPKKSRCPSCCKDTVEEILLSTRGTLYAFTNVNHGGPGGYKGPIPYGVGKVQLPEGVRVLSHLTEWDPNKLKAGMDMELVVEPLFEDDQGNEVISFKFRPA